MSILLDVMLRSSAILGVALLALPFLRRRSAAFRHSVLAGAMAASALVLPLSWALPAWTVQVPAALTAPLPVSVEIPALGDATVMDAAEPARHPAPANLMVAVWAMGVMVGALALALAFGRLHRVVSRAGHL